MVRFCLWVLVCASSWTSSVDIDELTFGKNRWYPSQSPSVFWLCLILLKSFDGFPITFFEVVSFPVVLMTDISSINPKPRASNNVVYIYLFRALGAFGTSVFWLGLIFLKSFDGFPLTFFEVASFPVVLMTDISSINPKPRDSNNIAVFIDF